MSTIYDPFHDTYIPFTRAEINILKTPEMQRLRYIKQLGFTFLEFPNAHHTRYDHSIGAMYSSDCLCEVLQMTETQRRHVPYIKMSALLHDAGQGAFSHLSERVWGVMTEQLQVPIKTHEDVTLAIIEGRLELDMESGKLRKSRWRGRLRGALEVNGFDALRVKHILNKKEGYRSEMISSSLDVDRSDYLLRDGFYTGATFSISSPGMIKKLWSNFAIYNGKLVLKKFDEAIRVANHFLVARATLYSDVYTKQPIRMANAMFMRAVESHYENKRNREKREAYLSFFGKTDDQLFCELESSDVDVAGRLIRGIRYGHSYEVVKKEGFKLNDIHNDFKNIIEGACKAEQLLGRNRFSVLRDIEKIVEQEVSSNIGVDTREQKVIVDIPEYPLLEEADTLVLEEDDGNQVTRKLQEVSPSYYQAAYEDMLRSWSIQVFISEDLVPLRNRIKNHCARLFCRGEIRHFFS